jgi:hypothetical protein
VAEQQRADTEAATAKAVNEFLQKDLLGQASGWSQTEEGMKADPDLKVRTALDRAAQQIEKKFSNRPLVEAAIRHTIGAAYDDLGVSGPSLSRMRELEITRIGVATVLRAAFRLFEPGHRLRRASGGDLHVDRGGPGWR